VNRADWCKHAPDVVELADAVLAVLRRTDGVPQGLSPNYTRNYIGVLRWRRRGGTGEMIVCNFVRFARYRNGASADFRLPETAEYRRMTARGGLLPRYNKKMRRYRLVLTRHEVPPKAALLQALGRAAYARHPNRHGAATGVQLKLPV